MPTKTGQRIIDGHLHLFPGLGDKKYFPDRQAKYVCMHWAYGEPGHQRDLDALYPRHEERFSDPDGSYNISSMDHGDVDAALLLPIDYEYGWGSRIGANEKEILTIDEKHAHIADLQNNKYPGRFYAAAGPDPRRPNAPDIFERAVKDYNLKGLKIIPGNGYTVWDRILYPMYDVCLEYDLPVFSCTMAHPGGYTRPRFNDPLNYGDIACDFPDLKFVLLHAGFPFDDWFDKCLWVTAMSLNAYLQFDMWLLGQATGGSHAARDAFPNIFSDEERVVTMLMRAKAVVGTHRMIWGTDSMQGPAYNNETSVFHTSYKKIVDWVKNLPETAQKYGHEFTQEDADMFIGGSLERLLKAKAAPELERKHKYGWKIRYPRPSTSTP